MNRRRRNANRKPKPDILQRAIGDAPASNDSRLVFKWQKTLKSYDTATFKPEKTDNKMTAEEMKELFISLHLAKHYKADDGSDSVVPCLIFLTILAVITFVIFLFFLIF